ncbi:DNA/RNA non-specific endonuclease [bacterium]|nr:DNA/RNA non-specific endonuclease [bacterium]
MIIYLFKKPRTMKNVLFTLISFLIFVSPSKCQDTVRLTHTNYEWWLTKAKVECQNRLARKDAFQPDPLLPKETDLADDYKGSGFDRGHMMPAAENQCQTPKVQEECFYFSNMAAQYHSLNAGDWKSVETMERELASANDSLKIWCGNIGVLKKIGNTSAPEQCWKVIYIKKKNEYMAFLFKNDQTKPNGIEDNKVDVKLIEKLTGFKFR